MLLTNKGCVNYKVNVAQNNEIQSTDNHPYFNPKIFMANLSMYFSAYNTFCITFLIVFLLPAGSLRGAQSFLKTLHLYLLFNIMGFFKNYVCKIEIFII